MSYGMIIADTGGNVIVDETHPIFVFRESGSHSIVDSGTTTIDITDTDQILWACIRPSTACHAALLSFVMSGTTRTGFKILTDGTGTIDWAVFQSRTTTAIPKYGIVIYDSSEDVVFHSNDNYMVSKYGYSFPPTTSITSTREIPAIDADNNYFVFEAPCYFMEYTYTGAALQTTYYMLGVKKNSSSRLEGKMIKYYDSNIASTHSPVNGSVIWSINGYISEYNSAK